MPHYKLTYFNMMGHAEHLRLIFVQAGQEYEDNRITHEEWAAFKPKTPFGQMPMLEVDGKMLAQTTAISTYLAKQFGLNGKDDWEAAKIQMLQAGIEDLITQCAPWFREQDANKKKEMGDRDVQELLRAGQVPGTDRCSTQDRRLAREAAQDRHVIICGHIGPEPD